MKPEVPEHPAVVILSAEHDVAIDVADRSEVRADRVDMLDSVLRLLVPLEGLEGLPGARLRASRAREGAPPQVSPVGGGVHFDEVAYVAQRAVRSDGVGGGTH